MKNKELIMNILLKQKFITDQGINYKGEKDVALNEILNLIALAVQQARQEEREKIIEMIKETQSFYEKHKEKMDNDTTYNLTHADGVIGISDDYINFIKAINQESL